jgi:hypothetical protein
VPYLRNNPVFFYYPDRFRKPNPFQPDVAVSIDRVLDKKLDALVGIESQFYEGGANGSADLMPSEPARQEQRRRQVREGFAERSRAIARDHRRVLGDWYGKEQADKVQAAEAFEVCEYGRQPKRAELAKLFPFFGQ